MKLHLYNQSMDRQNKIQELSLEVQNSAKALSVSFLTIIFYFSSCYLLIIYIVFHLFLGVCSFTCLVFLQEVSEQQAMEKSELFSEIQSLQKDILCLSSSSLVKEKENMRKDLDKTKTKLRETEFKLKNTIQEKTKLEVLPGVFNLFVLFNINYNPIIT